MKEIKCYNETEKLELSYVMLQTLANECYRLQLGSQRFNRLKKVKETHFKYAVNRSDKKRAQKLVDIEMKNFDNEVNKYIKNTNFMCDSFAEQMPNKVIDLVDIGTDFLDKLFVVK
tara:strand:+ start:2091 stop:2438 length:348 start_codon:yes stop_codon:yes gene_type:complete